jgi:hypothetical protein
MKRIFFTLTLLACFSAAHSQSWNPYLNQGIVSPAPLHPADLNGLAQFQLNIGNTGSSVIPLVAGDELKVILVLSGLEPAQNDPIQALSGSWLSYFDWTYEASSKTYRGLQNQDLPPVANGVLLLECAVTQNSLVGSSSNGVEAWIIPPAYMGVKNHSMDDKVSSYTYTQALDYGDAPSSYGMARHEIDFNKVNGVYTKYVMLGSIVDAERVSFNSSLADADDIDGVDDEDGVALPVFVQGGTVSIPVYVNIQGNSFGFLRAWIDWNADGDFADQGEDISGAATPIFNSGIQNLIVNVPATAVAGASFARFRVGNYGSFAGMNTWGEVEDYSLEILPSQAYLSVSVEQVAGPNPISAPGQVLNYRIKVQNNGSSVISGIQMLPGLPGAGAASIGNPTESVSANGQLEIGESWIYNASYTVTQQDIDQNAVLTYSVSASGTQFAGPAVASCATSITRWVVMDASIDVHPSSEIELGQTVHITYFLVNKGNVSLSGLNQGHSVSGSGLLSDLNLNTQPVLQVGDTAIFDATYIISPADVIQGQAIIISFNGKAYFGNTQLDANAQASITTKASQHKVGLLNLDAEWVSSNDVDVSWKSVYEINNTSFVVLRRHQTEPAFYPIGTVAGAGNSLLVNSYSLIDDVSLLPGGWILYSIDQTDLTDSVYSTVNTVIDELDGMKVSIYPLPVKDVLNVFLQGAGNEVVQLELLNSLGQTISVEVEKQSDLFRMDLGMLPAGVYHLQIRSGEALISRKIVKP